MYIYKVYFLSECLLHWYIIYLKIFFILYVISCAFCQFVFYFNYSLYYFFFICLDGCLSFSLPCLLLCPAFSLALPTSVPSVPYLFPCPAFSLALPTSVPSYFLYLLIYFFFECKLHGYIASIYLIP